jgi:hypothetical protein
VWPHREIRKLHFPVPLRYSEDIDFVRTATGPIGPILDRIRAVLEPWLGRANFDQSPVAPKLRFRVPAEDDANARIRLKIEINTSEIAAYDPPIALPFNVENPWFAGAAEIATFSREEILATKLRAMLQRDKGRDLFDLAYALEIFDDLDVGRVVECFGLYIARAGLQISRAEAERRMFGKLSKPTFLRDMRPLLPPDAGERLDEASTRAAFIRVFTAFIGRLPGEPWEKANEMAARFHITSRQEAPR